MAAWLSFSGAHARATQPPPHSRCARAPSSCVAPPGTYTCALPPPFPARPPAAWERRFSYPYLRTGLSALVLTQPELERDIWAFLRPFHWTIWWG